MSQNDISKTASWQALTQHFVQIEPLNLNDLFHADQERFEHFSISTSGILLDYSKNRITHETINKLCDLAESAGLQQQIEALMNGDKINRTEHRAATHTACRDLEHADDAILHNLNAMRQINDALKAGTWLGFTKKSITDVVNIGIGGSDLGPKMVVNALTPYHQKIKCHFVSNIDATDLIETLKPLNAETTLFIVSSKSFNTIETKMNANSAKKWLMRAGAPPSTLSSHFIAITACPAKAAEFGIVQKNIITIDNNIGGRYSLWSAIGLPIVIAIGMENFIALLAGAHSMDEHFRSTPFCQNMPVIMALIGIWYIDFFHVNSHAIIAYDEYLQYFKAHLQQLDMESNGKHINSEGKHVSYATGPVIWGERGCNGQHAFHQLLHQGTQFVPADFIVPINSHNPLGSHHDILVANAFSQTQALMLGKTVDSAYQECLKSNLTAQEAQKLAPHKALLGNRPTNTLLIDKVTPRYLGALIALYEHKIFTQSVIWGINPFDQWGVELGKSLAESLLPGVTGQATPNNTDSSTNGLINYYRNHQS